MREILHLSVSDARHFAWKNGRGSTRELAICPPHASFERGDFAWRISRTVVEEDGPFSSFPEFERILVVTRGRGLVLTHGAEAPRARVRALEPYRFAGEWTTEAELVSGSVADFNVLFRRGIVEADVRVLKLGERRVLESLAAGHGFVHVLSGVARARVSGEEEPFELDEGESLWVKDLAHEEELELAGESERGVVLVVQLRYET